MVDSVINSVAGLISDVIPAAGEGLFGSSLTAADIGAGALVGGGLGAGAAALTGGKPGAGALEGGLIGGLIPVGGALGSDLGFGTTAGEALAGAAGGALGGAFSGTSPLTGALIGGGAGAAEGAFGNFPGVAPGAAAGGAGAASLVPAPDSTDPLALNPSGTPGTGTGDAPGGAPGGVSGAVTTPPSVGGAGAPGATPTSGGLGSFGDILKKNPGLLLGGLGLGASALKGNKIPELGPIQSLASQLTKQGQVLRAPLTTGVLPPGAQSAVDEAVKANQAQIRSQFASMGMPYGSTMETTALNEAALRGTQLSFNIAQTMFNAGISETQLAGPLLTAIANAQLSSDEALSKSIANFSAALAGGGLKLS